MWKLPKRTIILLTMLNIHFGNLQDSQDELAKCPQNYNCVKTENCNTNNSVIYPCKEDLSSICCHEKNIISDMPSGLPNVCGTIYVGNRVVNGEDASLGEFPWMALLAYKQESIIFNQFLCGGSLINRDFVLTAAHCLTIDPRFQLLFIRLGENNLETDIDCETTGEINRCSESHIDVAIDKLIPHEKYNNVTIENDIALIKLSKKVHYSNYIQPICLPHKSTDFDFLRYENTVAIISGWGKTKSLSVAGSSKLMYAYVNVWNSTICNDTLPPSQSPLKRSQLCAKGTKREDSCKGDSGGPLSLIEVDRNNSRNVQIGIVSFSSSQVCGIMEIPTIYTNVDYYLDWIVAKIQI